MRDNNISQLVVVVVVVVVILAVVVVVVLVTPLNINGHHLGKEFFQVIICAGTGKQN